MSWNKPSGNLFRQGDFVATHLLHPRDGKPSNGVDIVQPEEFFYAARFSLTRGWNMESSRILSKRVKDLNMSERFAQVTFMLTLWLTVKAVAL